MNEHAQIEAFAGSVVPQELIRLLEFGSIHCGVRVAYGIQRALQPIYYLGFIGRDFRDINGFEVGWRFVSHAAQEIEVSPGNMHEDLAGGTHTRSRAPRVFLSWDCLSQSDELSRNVSPLALVSLTETF